jgi:hypothetical protein
MYAQPLFSIDTLYAHNTSKVQTKLKPKKSAVKRFKVTATGKLLRSHSGKQHLAVKKSGACSIASFISILPLLLINALSYQH